jgi:hypothetical protein
VKTIAMIVAATAAVGCISDQDQDQEVDGDGLATEAEEFSSNWNYSWGDTKYSFADIGTATNRACFMSGVAGWLTTAPFPTGKSQGGAGVRINPATNRWEIFVDPTVTGTLQVWARCVNSTSLTAEAVWRSDQPRATIAPVAANRRCFFTKLTTGRDGSNPRGAFGSTLDNVYIANDGVNWYIDGSTTGLVWARARCINVTADLGQFLGWANPGNTVVSPLVSATNGATCLLTHVAGQLNNSNSWTQGPYVTHNAGYNFFDFNLKNGTGGRVRCVR